MAIRAKASRALGTEEKHGQKACGTGMSVQDGFDQGLAPILGSPTTWKRHARATRLGEQSRPHNSSIRARANESERRYLPSRDAQSTHVCLAHQWKRPRPYSSTQHADMSLPTKAIATRTVSGPGHFTPQNIATLQGLLRAFLKEMYFACTDVKTGTR